MSVCVCEHKGLLKNDLVNPPSTSLSFYHCIVNLLNPLLTPNYFTHFAHHKLLLSIITIITIMMIIILFSFSNYYRHHHHHFQSYHLSHFHLRDFSFPPLTFALQFLLITQLSWSRIFIWGFFFYQKIFLINLMPHSIGNWLSAFIYYFF